MCPAIATLPPAYPFYKKLIIALLIVNGVAFGFFGTRGDLLDSIAWLILLILFELETHRDLSQKLGRAAPAIHLARAIGIIGVGLAATEFVREKSWLDAANSGLWFAVVFLLELEIRFPAVVNRFRRSFTVIAVLLFSGLVILVGLWARNGELLDAYDALLWIIAFFTIEMNLLRATHQS